MDSNEAKKRANQIAQELNGPLGRIPLERVLARHVGFFEELRSFGVTWPQIATLLDNAGVKRKGGGTLSPSQFRATLSRIGSSTQSKDYSMPPQSQHAQAQAKSKPHPTSLMHSKDRLPSGKEDIRRRMHQANKSRTGY